MDAESIEYRGSDGLGVGLGALAQPRLTKGGQPYLESPANHPVSPCSTVLPTAYR